jgi:protein-S-isoprenylcysteine O-methyltransferase Ste14
MLKIRAIRRLAFTLALLAALLLLASGSLRFWQGELFIAIQSALWTYFLAHFLRHDPHLLEGRLQKRESQPEQQRFQKLWAVMVIGAFSLSGLDFRFAWTRAELGGIPLAVILAGQAIVAAGYWLVFWVMKSNTFASSTIRVEAEQHVIDSGPYAVVRHPMYSGMMLSLLAAPFALGSYVAFPVFVMSPIFIYRLTHEEQTLLRELPGYSEYCKRVKFRLLPGIW